MPTYRTYCGSCLSPVNNCRTKYTSFFCGAESYWWNIHGSNWDGEGKALLCYCVCGAGDRTLFTNAWYRWSPQLFKNCMFYSSQTCIAFILFLFLFLITSCPVVIDKRILEKLQSFQISYWTANGLLILWLIFFVYFCDCWNRAVCFWQN